jgi:hypothetical protein
MHFLDGAGLTPSEVRLIAHDNAAALLGLATASDVG